MGSKKAASAPAPPDPVATAQAQAAQNAETARVQAALNREDQYTPWGSLTYSPIGKPAGGPAPMQGTGTQSMQPVATSQPAQQSIWRDEGGGYYRDMNTGKVQQLASPPGAPSSESGVYYGAAPQAASQPMAAQPGQAQPGQAPAGTQEQRWQSTVTLSPAQQRLLDLQNEGQIMYGETAKRQMGAVSDRLAQPLDFSGMGPAPVANEAMRAKSYDAIMARMMPQMDRDRAALEAKLYTQGLNPGSQAWNAQIDDWTRSLTDARLAADQQASNEMARLYGMETDARNRAINELVMQRQIPMNELAAMMSGSQVQAPNFVPSPQTQLQPTDLAGAVYGSYNGQLNAANSANQRAAQQTQGLFGLLGNAAMASAYAWSDRRLKRDARVVGKLPNGLPLYRFRYLWSDAEETGVMADDVRAILPHAVKRMPNGFDAVNYAEIV